MAEIVVTVALEDARVDAHGAFACQVMSAHTAISYSMACIEHSVSVTYGSALCVVGDGALHAVHYLYYDVSECMTMQSVSAIPVTASDKHTRDRPCHRRNHPTRCCKLKRVCVGQVNVPQTYLAASMYLKLART